MRCPPRVTNDVMHDRKCVGVAKARVRWAGAVGALLLAMTVPASSFAAERDDATALRGTPFEHGVNAAALGRLMNGATVRRTSLDGTMNADDWARMQSLGVEHAHSAAVALHFVPSTVPARQIARLESLARAIVGFAPAGVCDRLVSEGDGRGLCTSTVDGPIGKVDVRLPVVTQLTQGEDGAVHLVMRNMRPVEAKGLLSWSPLVATNHLAAAVDFYPSPTGWFVYTRVVLEMADHESSAKTLSDAFLKLDAWLCASLAHT